MKTIKIPVVVLAGLLIFSCKKDKKYDVPASTEFSAAGYWTGRAYPNAIGILNKPDGASRLYLLSNTLDTSATWKYDGVYTVEGDLFRFKSSAGADRIGYSMETTNTASHSMKGVFIS